MRVGEMRLSFERGNAIERGAGSGCLPLSQLGVLHISSYILQVHAQSAIQSNELCLNSNLPLLLQERGADNVEVSKVGPWTEGRTITGHAIESYWPL